MDPRQKARVPAFLVVQDSNFRTLWYVVILSELARHMEILVLGWFILQKTDSVFNLGLIMVFYYLPRPLVSMPGGMIADRFNRQRIMLASRSLNILTASSIFILFLTDTIQPWHALAAPFLHGLARAFEDPSRRTAIFDIVGQGRVVSGISLEAMGNNGGKLIGPVLGGILLSLVGFSWAYTVVLLVHAMVLALLFRVRIPQSSRSTVGESLWRSLVVALRYVLHSPVLLGLLYVTILMNVLVFPLQQFIPAVGRDHLGVGAALVGLLLASDAIGQLIAAGVMASMKNPGHHGRLFVAGSLTNLVMAVLFVWSPWYALSFAFLTVLGMGQAAFGTMQGTITMLSSPPEMRGRARGLVSLCIGLAIPLGALEIGIVATVSSIQWAILVNAVVGLALFLPVLVLTPIASQRTHQRPSEIVRG